MRALNPDTKNTGRSNVCVFVRKSCIYHPETHENSKKHENLLCSCRSRTGSRSWRSSLRNTGTTSACWRPSWGCWTMIRCRWRPSGKSRCVYQSVSFNVDSVQIVLILQFSGETIHVSFSFLLLEGWCGILHRLFKGSGLWGERVSLRWPGPGRHPYVEQI